MGVAALSVDPASGVTHDPNHVPCNHLISALYGKMVEMRAQTVKWTVFGRVFNNDVIPVIALSRLVVGIHHSAPGDGANFVLRLPFEVSDHGSNVHPFVESSVGDAAIIGHLGIAHKSILPTLPDLNLPRDRGSLNIHVKRVIFVLQEARVGGGELEMR